MDSGYQSSELLDELCKHGSIRQVTLLLSSNGQTTLSELTYNVSNSLSVIHILTLSLLSYEIYSCCNIFFVSQELVGLLVKLSSRSLVAFRTLYELNISSILRDILCTIDLTNGVSISEQIGGHCHWVCILGLRLLSPGVQQHCLINILFQVENICMFICD